MSAAAYLLGPTRLRRGWWAGLDPRAKLLATLAFSLAAAVGPGRAAPAVALVLALGLVAASGFGLGHVLRRAVAVNAFVAFLWVFLPWRLEWHQGLALAANPGGLELALVITLKANAVFLCVLALLASTPVNDLLHALSHLRLPAKLVTLFLLFHRYLFVIHQEYLRLGQALKVRGFAPKANPYTWGVYARLVGALLVRALERAERVYQAMLCRGFDGTFWVLDHFHWRRRDSLFLGSMLAASLGLCWLR